MSAVQNRFTRLAIAAALTLASSASAQLMAPPGHIQPSGPIVKALGSWCENPSITYSQTDHITLPSLGRVLVIQMTGQGIEITAVDQAGNTLPSFYYLNGPMVPDAPVLGCSLGGLRFALGYQVFETKNLMVVLMRRSGNQFVVEKGPIAVGTGFDMRMAPRLTRSVDFPDAATAFEDPIKIDGVLVSWMNAHSSGGPHAPVYVRQQGVWNRPSPLVWPNAPDGVLVGESLQLNNLQAYGHPASIVSDSFGLGITTYMVNAFPGGFRYRTTTVDSTGMGFLTDALVPDAQSWITASPCFVARDGLGGAFYSYSSDVGGFTDLLLATVPQGGGGFHVVVDSMSLTSSLRPLAILPTAQNTAFLAYRDDVATVALRCNGGLGYVWTTFLSGASANNSEEVSAVVSPCGIASTWTRQDGAGTTIMSVEFTNLANGASVNVDEQQVNVPAGPSFVHRPQIVRRKTGVVFTWIDEWSGTIRGDALKCDGYCGL